MQTELDFLRAMADILHSSKAPPILCDELQDLVDDRIDELVVASAAVNRRIEGQEA